MHRKYVNTTVKRENSPSRPLCQCTKKPLVFPTTNNNKHHHPHPSCPRDLPQQQQVMALPVVLRRMVIVAAAVAALVVLWASSTPVGPPRIFQGDRTNSGDDIASVADQLEGFGHGAKQAGDNVRLGEDHRTLLTTGGVPGEGLLLFKVPVNSDEDAIDEFGDRDAGQESEAGGGGGGGGGGGHHGRHWHKTLRPLNRRVIVVVTAVYMYQVLCSHQVGGSMCVLLLL